MHVPAWLHLKRSGVFITRSFKLLRSQMSLWGIVWLICMQNVGALRMLGQCSRTSHLKMRQLGMPYWEDVLCMGVLGKLLNILNRCVKKVYTQMISLLFVFCQPVGMQVWWMKPCTCMLQWSETTGITQNWNIATAWLTFLPVLTVYRTENMILAMPYKPQAAAWMALLGACRIHGNVEMAEHVTKWILEMEPENAAGYVLLSTSMLLLATGISVRMLNNRERKKMQRNSQVAPGLKWIMRCIRL